MSVALMRLGLGALEDLIKVVMIASSFTHLMTSPSSPRTSTLSPTFRTDTVLTWSLLPHS
eukprot:3737913-Rhodomonas_salina.2